MPSYYVQNRRPSLVIVIRIALEHDYESEFNALSSIFLASEVLCESLSGTIRVFGEGGGGAVITVDALTYPEQIPLIEFEGLSRADARDAHSRSVEAFKSLAGGPMLFEMVTTLRDWLGANTAPNDSNISEAPDAVPVASLACQQAPLVFPVLHGAVILERKSTFQAHVAAVRSAADVRAALDAVFMHPRAARATHNMYAYRFNLDGGGVAADNDDDGEDSAGRRLAELLANVRAHNVLVVVSRSFGGVLLGPSRFAVINNAARELLVQGGFATGGNNN